jgi:hypothetical protein
MSAYQQSCMLKPDDADWVEFAENVVKGRKESARPDLRLRWAGVVLLVVLIAGLGWFVYHYVREKVSAHENQVLSPQTSATCLGGSGRTSSELPDDAA